jgi:uncharacterized protein (TIGR03437 family)
LIYVLGAALTGTVLEAAPDASGLYPFELGGVRVLFDGVAAPVLRVEPGRVLTVTPFRLAEQKHTMLEVNTANGGTPQLRLDVIAAEPKFLLRPDGFAIASSARGEIVPGRGAVAGETITMLLTGFGDLVARPRDGAIAGTTPHGPALTVRFEPPWPETLPQPSVLYFGPAPGLVEGVMQLNVRLVCAGSYQELLPILHAGEFTADTPTLAAAYDPQLRARFCGP